STATASPSPTSATSTTSPTATLVKRPTATAAARPASSRSCAPTTTAALKGTSAPTTAASCGRKAPAAAAPATASMTVRWAPSTCWASGICWTAWTKKSTSKPHLPHISEDGGPLGSPVFACREARQGGAAFPELLHQLAARALCGGGKSGIIYAACRETRHAAKGATAAHGNRLTRPFPLLGTPSTKFCGKSRTRRYAPRTQFAVKFPCRCRRRRRMSADGDGFRLFRQSGLPCKGRCRLRRRRGALPPCSGTVPARLPQRPSESRRKHRPAGVSRRRCVFCGESLFPKATRSKASPARGGAASGGGGVHCRLAAELSLHGRRNARQRAAANIAPQ